MNNFDATKIFSDALKEIQQSIGVLDNLFPKELVDDLMRTEVVFQTDDPSSIYDHRSFQRKFFLSELLTSSFARYWRLYSTGEPSRIRMCQLFYLHEFFHIGQGIDSNGYALSRNTKGIIGPLDHAADAFAVEGVYLMQRNVGPWQSTLADVVADHIRCGEVFSRVDDSRQAVTISGARLRRQLLWWLQYARVQSVNPELAFEHFQLSEPSALEVLEVAPVDRRKNLTEADEVTPNDLAMIEIHIIWNGRRIVHSITVPLLTGPLIKAVFEGDFDQAAKAFRTLFAAYPELVARPASSLTLKQKGEDDWQRIEVVLCRLLPEGPNENEIWSRAGGSKSMLRQGLIGRAQWHSALELIKNGGGTTLDRLLRVVSEDFENDPELKFLTQNRPRQIGQLD